MKTFDSVRDMLRQPLEDISWIEESGLGEKELITAFEEIMRNEAGLSKAMMKAKTIELLATGSRIAIDREDIFQDKLFGGDLLRKQRLIWQKEVTDRYLQEETLLADAAWKEWGAYQANSDFGHTSPNSKLLLEIGFPGLLRRVEKGLEREGLEEKQKDFYRSCAVTCRAAITYLNRLADLIEPDCRENAIALRNLAKGAPGNLYEAMQLLIAYFFFHEYVGRTRVRTLGRLDVLLYPFYKKDLESGKFTKEEVGEMLKFFFHKFWSARVPFDLPFCLGGLDADGNEVTNELSYWIVETYRRMNIHSPKIHIRVSEQTPASFVRLVLKCIAEGNSSFVFVNDNVGIKSLVQVGIEEQDAINYVPIGCYEPAVWGAEIGCTGNGGVNLAKAVELVFTNGVDHRSGAFCGAETGIIENFEDFVSAVKKQIRFMTEKAMGYITSIERYYGEIGPDPLLSAMYDQSVETGVDVFEGGAKYNNSSLCFWCIASLVDSVAAVKKLVYEDGDVSFEELSHILKNNWAGAERLRRKALNLCEKYGNGNAVADGIAAEMSNYVSELVNGQPNGRGGVFKASLFSIDHYVSLGRKTMATPDGRFEGEILSKNLCASTGMDRNGITALIGSVTGMDLWKFPNGSVLDVILHPSAVAGEEGLEAFRALLLTYFKKGGFAMHGNVFCAEDLKRAQKDPERYRNLQVRVCGWNAYFVNLSKAEQDAFIKQAEGVGA